MKGPADIAVTATSVYVLDRGNYRVVKWLTNGSNPVTVAGVNGTTGTSLSTFASFYFIFVDQYDNLYVSDTYNHRVLLFNASSLGGMNGKLVAGTGSLGSSTTKLNTPNGLFVDGSGTLYIADFNNHRIQRWPLGATSGTRVAGDGAPGSPSTHLTKPTFVVVDNNGYMYVTENQYSRVTRWIPNVANGQCIAACTGVAGTGPNQLNAPQALAFDSNGSLYVSDQSNSRVQKFQIMGDCGKYTGIFLTRSAQLLIVF